MSFVREAALSREIETPIQNVLLVDDSQQSLLALEAILDGSDCRIVKATSGEEALKHLLGQQFAVILLDIKMAGMDGYETAKLIREREKTRDIPIIFLTSYNKEDAHIAKGYAYGAVDYIIKPVLPETLRSKVSAFIELARRTAALRQKNLQLEAAEAALQERTRQLAERVEELARSNAELERFAYVASHDLKEPLRMVTSYTTLLARRYKGKLDRDADEFINYAVDGAVRMEQLIQDLLLYSRVGIRDLFFKSVDCEVVYARALANLEAALTETGALVTHDPLPTVQGDDTQLVQVFQNLIGNGIKFRGELTPCIHVSVKDKKKEWLIAVEDNGIGIDPQYADRIFVIFQRLHGRADYPGNGIGLAICKKVVENHGGRIWLKSQCGKGATFYFTIPK
ncbi:MAG TPA: ATP-binding protein [Nitrospirales bacterium]|jgi:signal transduction histidine kinase